MAKNVAGQRQGPVESEWHNHLDRSIAACADQNDSRIVQVATVRPDNTPACRSMGCLGFLPGTSQLKLMTHRLSLKVPDLQHNPWVEVCWYLPTSRKSGGQAILLSVGGAAESLLDEPCTMDLVLKRRKGFIRIALETGASLVPVIGFGENELYCAGNLDPKSRLGRLQRQALKLLGWSIPYFYGDPLLFGSWGYVPRRVPLNIVTGPPLNVPKLGTAALETPDGRAAVEEYHKKYITALTNLYDQYKDSFATERKRELRLVE
ncbi:hypothetical protein WJX72_005754 [[Myrmecia] bisecta]|uniref:diacylglycerol O-acyltransferase n=1 Tax=[Myrmecia] bisecta TaxID=41462 RepID=A0AAW1R7A9_9CHLO